MNKNEKTETEIKTDIKPQVRIVDLEEVREILGAAAPGGGTGTGSTGTGTIAPPDTTMCSW
ncbi:MAG TPA: hypothetical protein VIV58_30285 [Kofleriaceae bacterium]